MTDADTSAMNSEDVLQQIKEETSRLAEGTGEPVNLQEELQTEEEPQGDQAEVQAQDEQTEETSGEEETTQSQTDEEVLEELRRIKYRGKEIVLPKDLSKLKEYIQKGYKVEDTIHQIRQQNQPATQDIDFSRLDEEIQNQVAKEGLTKTLLTFTQTVIEAKERERSEQRKVDKLVERDMQKNVPHWDAIVDTYREYREQGLPYEAALAKSEADLFKRLWMTSTETGVREGAKKQQLKDQAKIPSGAKKGTVGMERTVSPKDVEKMTSEELLKYMGLEVVKHPQY